MAGIAFGSGIIFTAMTRKYRDLNFLIVFGVQLMMYATPVVYPISSVPERYRFYIMLNPLTHVVEAFKYAFLGTGTWSSGGLLYSAAFAFVVVVSGVLVFNRTERTFMDIV
jgi:lipopolysaccharide transport system permease protein